MEYYNNIGMDKKIALYFNGGEKTAYIFDSGQSFRNITVMQRSNKIVVFDNVKCEKLFDVEGVVSFKLERDAIVYCNGEYYGAYSYNGKAILETAYLKISQIKDYFKVVDCNQNIGLYHFVNGVLIQIIKPAKYLDIRVQEQGIVVYKEINSSKLKGYYSLDGKEIIEPKYVNINFNSDGIYVTTLDDKIGFFSYQGNVIVPPIYDGINPLNNSFIVYKQTKKGIKKYGLYTKEGAQVLKTRYDGYITKSPYAIFTIGQLYSVYDLITGKRILPLKFRNLDIYYNVIYATEDLKTFTLYSAKTGKKLLDDKFEHVNRYGKYILKVGIKNKCYYYLTRHNTLLDIDKWSANYSEEYQEVVIKEKNSNSDGILYTEWAKYQN